MKCGDLVFLNFFGEDQHAGIVLEAVKQPKGALEFFQCKVLFNDGKIRKIGSSYLLTIEDMDLLIVTGIP